MSRHLVTAAAVGDPLQLLPRVRRTGGLTVLNVLAGPAHDRSMAFCDDPAHHWIRDSWNTQSQDPRLPWTTAHGRTGK